MDEVNWPFILGAGIVASTSPGEVTMDIACTSMRAPQAARRTVPPSRHCRWLLNMVSHYRIRCWRPVLAAFS